MLGRFDPQRVDAAAFGILSNPIEEHRLSDAAKPHHDDALRRPAKSDALQCDARGIDQFVSHGELWGWGPCAVGEWVTHGFRRRNCSEISRISEIG